MVARIQTQGTVGEPISTLGRQLLLDPDAKTLWAIAPTGSPFLIAGNRAINFGLWYPGVWTVNTTLLKVPPLTFDVLYENNFSGSSADLDVAPATPVTFYITLNGTDTELDRLGSFTFQPGQTRANFIQDDIQNILTAGDILRVISQAAGDPSASGLAFNIGGREVT